MKLKKIAALVAIAAASGSALATNGYFSHGYGLTAKGMGGAATATAKDAFGGANNPASMVWVGTRMDVGIDWFSPNRSYSRPSSNPASNISASASSGSNNFYVPEFGYNRMISSDMSLGVTVYGNGGMNTNYAGGQITAASGVGTCQNFRNGTAFATTGTSFNGLCGDGNLGVDLMQLVIAPTFAMKVGKDHSFGVSPLIGYQRFKAEGLHGFAGYSSDSSKLTNNGYDDSHGFGVRVGWMSKLSPSLSVGAAYSSKVRMSKFDKYAGLFAEQGDFDMPENWNIGLAYSPNDQLTFALDFQRINYSGVKSVSNSSRNPADAAPNLGIANSLGCPTCRGFGWQDVDVVKLGMEYRMNQSLTLRAGYNHGSNPVQARDVTFNIIAPGVVQDHYTLGGTYSVSKDSEVTVSYMHAAKKSVTSSSLFDSWLGAGGGGSETIQMYQNALGVAYSVKY